MYSINNIPIDDFDIIPSRAENSNIALSGHLDMPKRTGKTFHKWDDGHGVEPYVQSDEIYYEGRAIVFHGFLKGNDKQAALNRLSILYFKLNAFTDLVTLSTPFGNYEVYIKEEITVDYIGQGLAQIKMTFREPVVVTPMLLPVGASEELYNIDGVALQSLGAFVTKVSGNFSSPQRKEARFTVYGKEGFQITKSESMLIDVDTIFYAEDYTTLASNVNKLHALLASPGIRNMNIDGRLRECFNVTGFKVENIKIANNMALCKLTFQMMTARDGDPIDTDYLLDNEYNNIVTNLEELIKINS